MCHVTVTYFLNVDISTFNLLFTLGHLFHPKFCNSSITASLLSLQELRYKVMICSILTSAESSGSTPSISSTPSNVSQTKQNEMISVYILKTIIYTRIKMKFQKDLKKKLSIEILKRTSISKKYPSVQKCFKVIGKHCVKNLNDLLKC